MTAPVRHRPRGGARVVPGQAAPAALPPPPARPPRQVPRWTARRLVAFLHLWVGLVAGGVIAVVGLTGSLYVLEPEITAALNADLYQATGDGPVLDALAVARRAEAEHGAAVQSIQWPMRARETYQLKLFDRDDWIFVDPHTGATLGRDANRASVRFFQWVLDVHTSLTMGEAGRVVTGASALLLALVLVSSGIYMWWPRTRARWREAFRVRWRGATAKRRLFDLHAAPGAWTSVVLVALALTGAYWSFPEAAQRVVDAVTRSAPAPADPWKTVSIPGPGPMLSLEDVLARTDTMFAGYHRRNLWMTRDSAGAVYMSWIRRRGIEAGGEWRPMMWLDPRTGGTITRWDPEAATLGTRVTNVWFPPVHYGEVGGLPTRVLAFVGGLMPAALLVSGVLLWRRRARRR